MVVLVGHNPTETQVLLKSLRDKAQPLLSRQRSCDKKKENKPTKKTLKNQSKPPSSTRIRRQKLRLASSLSRAQPVLPPVLEITVFNSQTHPVCLCHLSFQRCFQAFLRRSRNQQCFPMGNSAFVNRTAFPGMKAREKSSSCCKIWKSRAMSIAGSNLSRGLHHQNTNQGIRIAALLWKPSYLERSCSEARRSSPAGIQPAFHGSSCPGLGTCPSS